MIVGFGMQPHVLASTAKEDVWSKEEKYNMSLAGAMVFVTGWGISNWDYGERSPHAQREGWFGENANEGGADKVGHLHFSYTLGSALSPLYRYWGFSADEASRRACLSSMVIMEYMEIGDSFSNYGFSYEDFIMSLLGANAAYYLDHHSYWDERFAIRVEYPLSAIPCLLTTSILNIWWHCAWMRCWTTRHIGNM